MDVSESKKDPTILTDLDRLLEDQTAGDPYSKLKWKHKSLRRLSQALAPTHQASPPTVGRLLGLRDYSRKVNRKQLAISSPHRDEQFQYVQGQKPAFLQRGSPIIHVDTRKRELIVCNRLRLGLDCKLVSCCSICSCNMHLWGDGIL